MGRSKCQPQTALFFNPWVNRSFSHTKNTLSSSGSAKPKSPPLSEASPKWCRDFVSFKCQNQNQYFYHFSFVLRIAPAFHSAEDRDESCYFLYKVCKLIEPPGFKHREQLGKKTGSYEITHQIRWERLQMFRSFRDKEKVWFLNKCRTKHSVEHTDGESHPWALCSAPTLSLGDRCSRIPPVLLLQCISPHPTYFLYNHVKQIVTFCPLKLSSGFPLHL